MNSDDFIIAYETPMRTIGIRAAATRAVIGLIPPKAPINLPRLIEIIANVAAITIVEKACWNPIGLTLRMNSDDFIIA